MKLLQYFDFWGAQDRELQAHQIYFRPAKPSDVRCTPCSSYLSYNDVIAHIRGKKHYASLRNYTTRTAANWYLIDECFSVYSNTLVNKFNESAGQNNILENEFNENADQNNTLVKKCNKNASENGTLANECTENAGQNSTVLNYDPVVQNLIYPEMCSGYSIAGNYDLVMHVLQVRSPTEFYCLLCNSNLSSKSSRDHLSGEQHTKKIKSKEVSQ